MSIYAWESNTTRTWDALVEGADGSLSTSKSGNNIIKLRRSSSIGYMPDSEAFDDAGKTICRSLIRYICILIDASQAFAETDLRPSRKAATIDILNGFILSFFDENPLANLAIVVSSHAKAQRISEMSASVERHYAALRSIKEGGEFSLQNGLQMCRTVLQSVPQHAQKEILVIMSSLNTCDPGDIYEELEHLEQGKVRTSVVSLSAEVHIAKRLAEKTQGRYGVSKTKEHFKSLVLDQIQPPPILVENRNELRCNFIRMGFPSQNMADNGVGGITTRLALCADSSTLSDQGYSCPRCKSITSSLPSKCNVCSLELIASSHLARSYHHLFPVPRYYEHPHPTETHCFSCESVVSQEDKGCFLCPKCAHMFCRTCESFVHETLHSCKCH